MKLIQSTNADVTYKVDDEDYERLSQYRWWTTSRGHAQGYVNGRHVYMHWLIIGEKDGYIVDHINGDVTDNRRCNLRHATYSQNNANSKKWSKPTSSQYKGVSWYKPLQKWTVKYYEGGKQRHAGYFECEHEAAEVYNAHMRRIYGEHARLNVVQELKDKEVE